MSKINKILFIDDDNICAYLNTALVAELDIANEVVSELNAEQALLYIQHHYSLPHSIPTAKPDLIFLDINMPGMDGFEFLEALKNMDNIHRSRFLIILLSTSDFPSQHEAALQLCDEVFACITKPLAANHIQGLLMAMHVC